MPATVTATLSTPAASAGTRTRFSRPRFAALVMIGVYPLITGLLYLIFPLTDGWLIWQRTLVIAPLMVVIMIYGLIPGVQKAFRSFLNPKVA